ncbi:MAG: GtrA family protein [Bacteroidia bacterium]
MKALLQSLLANKVVRYFFSAGTATVVDVGVYFTTYNYVLRKTDIPFIGPLVLTAPMLSLVISYSCGLFTNFFITRALVFSESELRGRQQLFRFIQVALGVLFMNYLFMKFLVQVLEWYPTVSRIISALSIGVMSYLFHKHYSFKGKKSEQ